MPVRSPDLSEAFDLTALVGRCLGDAELAGDLLDRFHDRLSDACEALERHVRDGDHEAAARVAHSLKGEAGSLAADGLQAGCAELEAALRDAELPALPAALEQVQSEAARCREAHDAAREALARFDSML
jgi:HPt (histidine-containing phosphotransfer) domain-containing protein